MKPFRISRRFLLRGAGGIAVGLPLLDVMDPARSARAQASGMRHFVAFYEQTGIIYDKWKPTGSGAAYTLSPTLAPLAAVQPYVTVIDGLQNEAGMESGKDDHQKGMGTMLTGTELVGSDNSTSGGGPSVDQVIANAIGTTTKFKSLQFGVQSGSGNVVNYMCFAGASQALPAESDPAKMFDRIFSGFTAPAGGGGTSTDPDPALLRLALERRSVLDAAADSYASLLPRVSVEDRAKLDAHLTAIRSIETRLAADPEDAPPTMAGTSCSVPTRPSIDVMKNDNIPAITKLQLDLLIMAHACDLTHVSALQVSREAADPVFRWVTMPAGQEITRGHHAISHDGDDVAVSQAQLAAIDKWHAEQFAYLVNGFITQGLIDTSSLVWVNGLAKGNWHSHGSDPPQPIVTAGGAGGRLATGQYLVAPKGTNTNDVYIALLQAAGVEATTFGNAAHCKGPLSGLLLS